MVFSTPSFLEIDMTRVQSKTCQKTYDGPASRTRTEKLGFSVRRLAITFPAVPPEVIECQKYSSEFCSHGWRIFVPPTTTKSKVMDGSSATELTIPALQKVTSDKSAEIGRPRMAKWRMSIKSKIFVGRTAATNRLTKRTVLHGDISK